MAVVETWQDLMQRAMGLEEEDLVDAWGTYGHAVETALAEVQAWFDTAEGVGPALEALYGALVAASQQVMCRIEVEHLQAGQLDHAFRAGQAYGISSVLNHLVDRLRDQRGEGHLEQLDAFSDMVHEEILDQVVRVGVSVEVLDARGEVHNP